MNGLEGLLGVAEGAHVKDKCSHIARVKVSDVHAALEDVGGFRAGED